MLQRFKKLLEVFKKKSTNTSKGEDDDSLQRRNEQPIHQQNPIINEEIEHITNHLASPAFLITENITIISHDHGRERRLERQIEKKELQSAIKYGIKDKANSGSDGSQRWRYTYKGVVYVTDSTSKHEITSWRLNDSLPAPGAADPLRVAGPYTCHTVFVVDCSASMRKADVPGFATRTAAVYECLSRQFVEPQLALSAIDRQASVVSLIEMSNEATVVLRWEPIDDGLLAFLQKKKNSYAKNHGNYLPALEELQQLMIEDAVRDVQLMVVFLSDGSPSDHSHMACKHGVNVWQEDGSRPAPGVGTGGTGGRSGRKAFYECSQAVACRRAVCESVHLKCVQAVQEMGDWFGRDRLRLFTVAFGAPSEDYRVLEAMAKVLPRSSFQKLGLTEASLQSAMTTLSSTLTSLRTETNPGGRSRARTLCCQEKADLDHLSPDDLYPLSYDIIAKWEFDTSLSNWVQVQSILPPHTRHGIAVVKQYFSKGAERAAFVATEVFLGGQGTVGTMGSQGGSGALTPQGPLGQKGPMGQKGPQGTPGMQGLMGGSVCQRIGPRLVAKESLYEDQHQRSLTTYSAAAIVQADASTYAKHFNEAARRHPRYCPSWAIRFVKCALYEVFDQGTPAKGGGQTGRGAAGAGRAVGGDARTRTGAEAAVGGAAGAGVATGAGERPRKWILSEPELEGTYMKWNNNGGKINTTTATTTDLSRSALSARPLGAIYEEDEEEEEKDEPDVTENDVIQAFSHFTLRLTRGQRLVVDLQGVYNPTDGFTLTDPAIHSVAETAGQGEGGVQSERVQGERVQGEQGRTDGVSGERGRGERERGRAHRNGATDRGKVGIELFLESHVCSSLCRWMQQEFVLGSGVTM
jgi:hypothetical protein